MYLAVYFSLFVVVILLSKGLHNRPKLASFVPEAAMIILVGIVAGLVFNLVMGNGYFVSDGSMAESLLSFSPTVFFVVLVSLKRRGELQVTL